MSTATAISPAGAAAAVGVQARMIDVSPELATKWLGRNDHNRALKAPRIKQYAADMAAGQWVFNGEAIKLSVDGHVLDGQHRLAAIVEADATIQTLVITGLPDIAQETMDQGNPRNFADVLKLRGEKYWNAIAGATRTVFAYERYQVPFVLGGARPSVSQLSRTLDRNPDIRLSVDVARRLNRPWMPLTLLGGLHYLLATADAESADDFCQRLSTGEDLARTSPIYVLRERLIEDHAANDGRRLTLPAKCAFMVLAWNAYLDGEELERLRWTGGGSSPDRFPFIRGMAEPGRISGGGVVSDESAAPAGGSSSSGRGA